MRTVTIQSRVHGLVVVASKEVALRARLAEMVLHNPALLPQIKTCLNGWIKSVDTDISNNIAEGKRKAVDGIMPRWYAGAQRALHAERHDVDMALRMVAEFEVNLQPRAPRGWAFVEPTVEAPAVKPQTVTVAVEAPSPVVRKPKQHVKKPAAGRGEIRMSSFADLKEYQENTMLLMGTL